jgi:Na+/melibiose symporter-like transporter
MSSLRELKRGRMIGFSLGNFGVMLLLMATESYSYNFYVYTIRIDSVLVSLGTTINMLVSAFAGIIFGVVLDNTTPGSFLPY